MKPIVAIILLAILSVGAAGTMAGEKLTGRPVFWYMQEREGPPFAGTLNSTVTVRGILTEIFLNYATYGFQGFHYYVLPALFVLNATETVWASDGLDAVRWDYRDVVRVAYDFDDSSEFSIGQYVEVNGWWEGILDTTFSMMIVVGPYVNDSYAQPVPSSS